jgi:CheY-like chemotaxis protein
MAAMPEPVTILLVDDNADVSGAFVAVLESLGYRALAAASGEDGLRLWRDERSRVALVLMDQTLPDMNGLDVIRRLRAEGLAAPCIMLSGYPADPEATNEIAAWLKKPLDVEELIGAVERALGDVRA